jgi:hypothetical protein
MMIALAAIQVKTMAATRHDVEQLLLRLRRGIDGSSRCTEDKGTKCCGGMIVYTGCLTISSPTSFDFSVTAAPPPVSSAATVGDANTFVIKLCFSLNQGGETISGLSHFIIRVLTIFTKSKTTIEGDAKRN